MYHRNQVRKKMAPYLFLLPVVALFSVLLIYPICTVIGYSVFDNVITNKEPVFIGLDNFLFVFRDKTFLSALWNTLQFTVLSVVFHLVLGMCFALLLNSNHIHRYLRGFFRAALILPWTFMVAIVTILWRMLLNPNGVLNYYFGMGLMDWFGTRSAALYAIIFVNIWAGYPFYMVSLLAGLQGISKDLYEAGKIDGANALQSFRYITLPRLMPIIHGLLLLDFIWTMQQLSLVWMITGGGPARATDTLGTHTYKIAFTSMKFSRASASAVIILVICLAVGVLYVKNQKERE